MEKKGYLTNENIAKKFKSNFELVSYAIQLAENMIHTGRDARVKAETQNRAMLILEEISQGKDQFDQIGVSGTSISQNGIVITEEINPIEQVLVEDRNQVRKSRFNLDDEG